MNDVDVQHWTAFSGDPAGGNPAGVVLADDLPTDEVMQQVAAGVGHSETAFVAPTARPGTHDVRYFAPAAEVPFCGHATIATGVAMLARDPGLDRVVLRTRGVGEVAVDLHVAASGAPVATLTSPPTSGAELAAADRRQLLAALGWAEADLDASVPVEVAHAGADHPVLAAASRERLADLDYRFDALRSLMLERGWTTVALVHRHAPDRWSARNPFPVGGVVEDPATGAAAAALGGLLRRHRLLPPGGRFTVEQGVDLGRPSVLHVDASGPVGTGVRVTGTAVRLPPATAGPPDRTAAA